MKTFALAALLALPVLGLASQNASAGNFCCEHQLPIVQKYYVPEPAVVFDRPDRDTDTKIRLRPGNWVYANCHRYSGWCQIEPRLYESAWVLRECLRLRGPYNDDDADYRRPHHRPHNDDSPED